MTNAGNGEDGARCHGFADRSGGACEILFEDRAFENRSTAIPMTAAG